MSIARPEPYRLCYILYAAMSQKAKTKLQIIQNKMIRFILDLGPRTHITTKHMADLNILKIPRTVTQL